MLEALSNKNSDNPAKGSSSESKNEKVISYGQGNLITSNNVIVPMIQLILI